MYVSTSAWLNPVKLPKIKDKKTPAPVMIDHLIVFDIDIPPFSRRNMERARKAAVDLLADPSNTYDKLVIFYNDYSMSYVNYVVYHEQLISTCL